PLTNLHRVPEGLADEEAVFTEPLAAAYEILTQIQLNPGDEVVVIGDGKLGKAAGVRTRLLQDWQSRTYDIVVEASGSAAGLELALAAVRPRGTLVLKSTIAGAHQVSLAPIVINEINVIGSRCGPFPDALEALAARRIAVTPLVEK